METIDCWSCNETITFKKLRYTDGCCSHCKVEIDLEVELISLRQKVRKLLDNDGGDGCYDAQELLKARDELRKLLPKQ